MRWQMVDAVVAFEPWQMLHGRKCVSLEEGCLLERFGQAGVLPQSLLLEAMVQHCRWLVISSSDFSQSALLDTVTTLAIGSAVHMGDTLAIRVLVKDRTASSLLCTVHAFVEEQSIAEGSLLVRPIPLANLSNPERSRVIWQEMYGKA